MKYLNHHNVSVFIQALSWPWHPQIKLAAAFQTSTSDMMCDKLRFNLRPYLLTTVSLIICILELQWIQEKLVCGGVFCCFFFFFLHWSAPNSSAGYRRSRVDKSGLYGRVAPTVYLLVTFAAQPQLHHNYPTYSLNRNHAWQEPPATKVAGLIYYYII